MGKTNYARPTHYMGMASITWGKEQPEPNNLIPFNEIKGKWTYPKKGFIQWKKE